MIPQTLYSLQQYGDRTTAKRSLKIQFIILKSDLHRKLLGLFQYPEVKVQTPEDSLRVLTLYPMVSFPTTRLPGLLWAGTSATGDHMPFTGHTDVFSAQASDNVIHSVSNALHFFVYPETSKTFLQA